MISRTLAALSALALTSAVSFAPASAAAAADCTAVAHTTLAGVLTTTDGEPGGPPSNALLTLRAAALEVALPDATSKALWLTAPPAGTKLADVRDLALRTRQLVPAGVSMPSLQVVINPHRADLPAFTFSTLVYEPYQSGHAIPYNEPKTWNALDGSERWWSTKAATDGGFASQSAPEAWSALLARYPDATVTAWGWNVGKGAPGTRAQLLGAQFGTVAGCQRHAWIKPVVTSPSTSASPSPTPSTSQTSASPSASATASTSTSPSKSATTALPSSSASTALPLPSDASDDGGLPVTGGSLTWLLIAGVAALGAGAIAIVSARRRRS